MFCCRENVAPDSLVYRALSFNIHATPPPPSPPPPSTIVTSKAVNYHKNIKQTLHFSTVLCCALLGSAKRMWLIFCRICFYVTHINIRVVRFPFSLLCATIWFFLPIFSGMYVIFFPRLDVAATVAAAVAVVAVCLIFIATISMKHKLLCLFPSPTNI